MLFKILSDTIQKIPNIRSCVICETLVFFKTPLCKVCRKYLFKQYQKNLDHLVFLTLHERDIPIFSVWQWDEDNDYFIRKLIVALKDGCNPQLYRLFANWSVQKLAYYNVSMSKTIYTVPSFDRRHPERMGNVFANKLQGQYLNILRKKKIQPQKEKSKQERLKEEQTLFSLKTNPALKRRGILLDDVMVTGTSLKACAELLLPSQIEYIVVWAEKQ